MDQKMLEDKARDYKVRLRKAMEPVLTILEEAASDGLEVTMGFGVDPNTKTGSIQNLKVSKVL